MLNTESCGLGDMQVCPFLSMRQLVTLGHLDWLLGKQAAKTQRVRPDMSNNDHMLFSLNRSTCGVSNDDDKLLVSVCAAQGK